MSELVAYGTPDGKLYLHNKFIYSVILLDDGRAAVKEILDFGMNRIQVGSDRYKDAKQHAISIGLVFWT